MASEYRETPANPIDENLTKERVIRIIIDWINHTPMYPDILRDIKLEHLLEGKEHFERVKDFDYYTYLNKEENEELLNEISFTEPAGGDRLLFINQ